MENGLGQSCSSVVERHSRIVVEIEAIRLARTEIPVRHDLTRPTTQEDQWSIVRRADVAAGMPSGQTSRTLSMHLFFFLCVRFSPCSCSSNPSLCL